jgi:hypothetical protein
MRIINSSTTLAKRVAMTYQYLRNDSTLIYARASHARGKKGVPVIIKEGEHGNVAIRIQDDAAGVKVISSHSVKDTLDVGENWKQWW